MNTPTPEELISQLAPLLVIVRAAIRFGIERTFAFFEQEGEGADQSLAPNLVRYYAKRYLDHKGHAAEDLEGDYERPAAGNNGLRLAYRHFKVIIRKSEQGELPVPSSGLQIDFYDHNQKYGFKTLEGPQINVIVLWDADYLYNQLVSFELVLPKSGGTKRASTSAFWQEPILYLAEVIDNGDDVDGYEKKDDEQAKPGG